MNENSTFSIPSLASKILANLTVQRSVCFSRPGQRRSNITVRIFAFHRSILRSIHFCQRFKTTVTTRNLVRQDSRIEQILPALLLRPRTYFRIAHLFQGPQASRWGSRGRRATIRQAFVLELLIHRSSILNRSTFGFCRCLQTFLRCQARHANENMKHVSVETPIIRTLKKPTGEQTFFLGGVLGFSPSPFWFYWGSRLSPSPFCYETTCEYIKMEDVYMIDKSFALLTYIFKITFDIPVHMYAYIYIYI